MRIQETDRVLKESRYSRHANAIHEHDHDGVLARVWRSITSLPERLTGVFRQH